MSLLKKMDELEATESSPFVCWMRLKSYVEERQTKPTRTELLTAAPDLLAACEAFVEAYEKSLQLEKTDVALRMAKQAIAKAQSAPQEVE